MSTEIIFYISECIIGIIVAVIYPLLTHTMHHELGHAITYLDYINKNIKSEQPTIHVAKNVIITPLLKMQAKIFKVQIRRDIREYLEINENEKCICKGITEMPAKLPDTNAVKKIAFAGTKNCLFCIVELIIVQEILMFFIRAFFVFNFKMPTTCGDLKGYWLLGTIVIWVATEIISFLLSGRNEGDFYYFKHPDKWMND